VGEGALFELFAPTGTFNPVFFVGDAEGSTTLNTSLEL
jgi:hypothetical protein